MGTSRATAVKIITLIASLTLLHGSLSLAKTLDPEANCLLAQAQEGLGIPLTNDEKIDLVMQFQSYREEGLSPRQRAWLTELLTSLSQSIKGEKPAVELPPYQKDALAGTQDRLDLILKELGTSARPFHAHDIIFPYGKLVTHAILAPSAPIIEAIRTAPDFSEIDRTITGRMNWTKDVTSNGNLITYSNAGYTEPIRLSQDEMGSARAMPSAVRAGIAEAIKYNQSYTSDSALPYFLAEQSDTQKLASVLRSLGWTRTTEARSKTVSFSNPETHHKITFTTADLGGYVHELSPAVRQEILTSARTHTDYTTPEAQLGLRKIGSVTPEEIQALRDLQYVDDLRGKFAEFGWNVTRDERTRNVTATNPVSGRKITFQGDLNRIAGRRDSVELADITKIVQAVENHTDYITPTAQHELQWKETVKPEELAQLHEIQYVEDVVRLFQKMGWTVGRDARTLNTTLTNPVSGKEITFNQAESLTDRERLRVSASELAAIANAAAHRLSYVSDEAKAALIWRQRARPAELQALREIQFTDGIGSQLKNLGWTMEREPNSTRVTFTNPLSHKKISYDDPVVEVGQRRLPVSAEVLNGVANAVERISDYSGPQSP